MLNPKKQIFPDSNEAAEYRTDITGWVSRGGLYFGKDEQAARYAGSTHATCECGKVIPKQGHTLCLDCRENVALENYMTAPRTKWDGETPLYSKKVDKYFFEEDLEEFAYDQECTVADLLLVICEPIYLREIADDFGCDELSEGGELPKDVLEAIEEFNRVIQGVGPVSWCAGKYAAIF